MCFMAFLTTRDTHTEPRWSPKHCSDSGSQRIGANLLVSTFEILKLMFAGDALWSNGYFLMSMKCVFHVVVWVCVFFFNVFPSFVNLLKQPQE